MKETPLPTRKTGRTEMDDLVSRLFPDLDEPKSGGFMNSSGLHLTLVHPEDETETIKSDAENSEDEILIDTIASTRLADESPSLSIDSGIETHATLDLCDGHSSGVDISIQPGIFELAQDDKSTVANDTTNESEPATLQFTDSWQLPQDDAASNIKNGTAPRRIGDGKLVPARLTWKPGDPFGQPTRNSRKTFRWELMLTTACVTAACGMLCIWLLRTVLA